MITMSSTAMKLCVVMAAISSFAIVHCRCGDAEGRKLDGVQYKNHRTTTLRNDTRDKTYPVYAAQVYANLSNARDFTTVVGEQPTDTPSPLQDVVRIYITPAPAAAKRKPEPPQAATIATTQTPTPNVTPAALRTSTAAAHPMVFVTAVQPPYYGKEQQRKSVPASSASQQHFLYATTQSPSPSPLPSPPPPQQSVIVGSSNNAQGSGNASKPFATVLVPKQMLDGGDDSTVGYNGARRDDPFRPIAAPSFSYKPTMTAVDANSVTQQQEPNRRMSSATVVRSRPSVAYKVQEDHSSAVYKVQEEHPPSSASSAHREEPRASDRTANRVRQPSPRDRADHAQRAKPVQQHQHQQENGVRRYATFATEPIVVRYEKTPPSAVDQQPREYYPATRAPPSAFHSYGPSGKPYESDKPTGPQPTNGAKEPSSSAGGPPTFVWPSNPPPALSESAGPKSAGPESAGPEFAVDDVNAKDVLKSLLRDMLKSKQRKPPFGGTDEVVQSYYSNRGNVGQDFGLDDYDIDTDMSCNLRSTRHITDGQCMTTKPVVEAVCADRCLVYDSGALFNQRQRSSPVNIKQDHNVEALHCVDGDVKFVRIQLKCRDGNTLNDVIRVVTNCRCKLHQIQPQMRSNVAAGSGSTAQQTGVLPNQDIMNIATGKF